MIEEVIVRCFDILRVLMGLWMNTKRHSIGVDKVLSAQIFSFYRFYTIMLLIKKETKKVHI